MHIREYTLEEIRTVVESAGFEIQVLFTEGYVVNITWVRDLLVRYGFNTENRGEQIYCVAFKRTGVVTERYPRFLYSRRKNDP